MKSILSTLLCALCVLSLNSCGDDENTDSVGGTLSRHLSDHIYWREAEFRI